MPKTFGSAGYLMASVLVALLGTSACVTTPAPNPPIASPAITATLGVTIPTPTPPATSTTTPTAPPTAAISELNSPGMELEIDRLATAFLDQGKSSALSIGIVIGDSGGEGMRVMRLNYGSTSKNHGRAVTSTTLYEIGSITKLFTGILLAQAVMSGEVGLNDPIQSYMPPGIQAPNYRGEPITLKELATHRSSLPRDPGTDSLSSLYTWLNEYQLPRAPGTQYAYSNLGYGLLGDILARLSGMDFGTLEFESISQPLGLQDTRPNLSAEQRERLAQGYTYDGSPTEYFPETGALSGAGYLRSTLQDMMRFLIANMQPQSSALGAAIALAQREEAEGPDPGTHIGLGWNIEKPGTPDERLWKAGATSGFTSYITFAADGSYGFVILNNGRYAETLVPAILGILSSR
jgi:D-alanyl-D-alanine-carboxypeptidase/D-alanyl-D-alanine-endopeptidase